ncbi:MAG: ACT domain-containing protein [Candidatus Micrarchaeia archaeon]
MKQITVVVEDQVGKLADVSFILGKSKINIDSISMGKIGDKSVIHLTVKNEEKAVSLLKANKYECFASDVLIVKLLNSPGELAKMTKLLSDAKIDVENVTVVTQGPKYSLYSMKVDRMAKAEKVLQEYLDIERT